MPEIPIIMPQLGESIAEAMIVNFLVREGDRVEADQDIIEVETNKAAMNVTSPCRGVIRRFTVKVGDSYPVGAVLGYIEATAEDAARAGLQPAPDAPAAQADPAPVTALPATPTATDRVQPTVRGLPVPANATGAGYMSPRLKARMAELGLHAADLAGVAGSGAGGRVTIQDFERFLAGLEQHRITPASPMRVSVADAMRRSWTRPLATVGLPFRLDPILAHRKRSGVKASPTLYAIRALALALAENSAPAGRLIGNRIVHPRAIDIGWAVEVEDGVLVPVLRNVDQRRLEELVPHYEHLLELARQRRLPAEASGGSIATVTNFGTFGLTWATPIPLPEQTLVLGVGASRRVPHWSHSKQQFIPVWEANLTLSFDHRVLDGGAAGRLLTRVAEFLSRPDQL
ncbi:2-oxo acid dehydrogenase subunit E2 [Limisphaera ngatamarikiensis]|uniref:Dihydrolipoamide acetyltransferase component of pyruvate dehydrogenase complex n=1 Tax=Limisphaera ngatamarikiensis TaxID=1324935 RepID=A0A6M1RQP3_9BACT|nr:2-oxo acid dehydrogenase subunit E2 [Limisphaera ngatamarikiensis]NGO39697.1 2-oxo acid dehydrogenase subunit E2 [Limisphaera ngatamarikiensis]